MWPHLNTRAGWSQLEATLLAIRAGEHVSVEALVAETGLSPDTIATVLNDLAKIQLFQRQNGNVFVRRSSQLGVS